MMAIEEEQQGECAAAGALAAERTLLLADGQTVRVRPIRPADAPALQRFHSRLSVTSVWRRFFQPVPRLDDERAAYFTRVDGCARRALVALDPDQPDEIIAVVRYEREEASTVAEYAIVVEDRWQHHGLGLALTRLLREDALECGIRSWYALVLNENSPMLHLFADLGLPTRTRHEDYSVLRVEIDLAGAQAG